MPNRAANVRERPGTPQPRAFVRDVAPFFTGFLHAPSRSRLCLAGSLAASPGLHAVKIARGNWRRTYGCAFTLIELILVMTLLMIVIAVSAPSLQRFFRGRNLDSEARRIYALTMYAQNRAVSEGMPVLVWFNARQKLYGMRVASSYMWDDPRAIQFAMDRDLGMEIVNQPLMPGTFVTPFVDRTIGNVPTIRFRPDGSIAETSPASIIVYQGQDDAVAIGLNTNNVRYEIQFGNPYAYRR